MYWFLRQTFVEAFTKHSTPIQAACSVPALEYKPLRYLFFLLAFPCCNILYLPYDPAAIRAVVRGAFRALWPTAATPQGSGLTQQTDPAKE